MKYFYIVILIFSHSQINAQTPIFKWAKAMGGIADKTAKDISIDQHNNIYTTGYFKGTVDFDPDSTVLNLSSSGNDDIFITKLNNQGQFIWAKKIGGTNQDKCQAICIDSTGNIYLTGTFAGTVDFNPGAGIANLTAIGGLNSFICKLDSNGNYLWSKKITNGYNEALELAVDPTGNSYITGYFSNTTDFDPNAGVYNLTAQSFAADAFVLKLDNLGNFIWAKAFSGFNDEFGYAIDIDYAGNVFTTGNFYGTVDFDPGINSYNLTSTNVTTTDVFITKLDTDGNFLWAHAFGDSLNDFGYKIEVDSMGNSYTIGSFVDTIDFDPSANNYTIISDQGTTNGFMLKLNPSGNFVWANGIVGFADLNLLDIHLDHINNIYITGTLSNTADFDPGSAIYNLSSNGNYDIIIAKYTNAGGLDWAKNMGGYSPGGIGGGFGSALVTDNLYNVYIAGVFGLTVDFDPSVNVYNLTSIGNIAGDIFTLKLGPCIPSSYTQFFTFCPGPGISVGNNTYYTSGVYIDSLFNATGCDSIVTTNLTVYPIYDSLQTIYLCSDDSLLIGGIFQNTTGVYIDTIIDANGCINTITTTLLVFSPINTYVTVNNNNLSANYPPVTGVTYQWLDCNNNFSPISGETNQNFTPIANGSYAVLIDNSNCQDTSACYDFVTVGLPQINEEYPVLFYPNPVKDLLTYSLQNITSKTCSISLYNLNGEIIFKTNSSKGQINMSQFAPGIYVLSYFNNTGAFHHKLIKE